jgi:hypothetical protein
MNIKTLTAVALAVTAFTTATVNAYALSSVVHLGGGGAGKTLADLGHVRTEGGGLKQGLPATGGLPGVQGVKINPPVLPRPVEVDRDHDRDRFHFGRIVRFDRFVSDYDDGCHYVRKFWRIVKVCPEIY